MKVKRFESELLGSNTFVLTQGKDCLIIDAGCAPEIIKKSINGKRVVGVLLTHGHYDHVYYAEAYKKLFDCLIYISKQGKQTAMDANLNYGGDFYIKKAGILRSFDKDKKIKCGSFEIKAFLTPGHCAGCACYLIDDHLFAGDTLFKTGIGRLDLVNSDKFAMIESLKKLEWVEFKTLHSGHGEDSTFEEQKRNITVFLKYLERKV